MSPSGGTDIRGLSGGAGTASSSRIDASHAIARRWLTCSISFPALQDRLARRRSATGRKRAGSAIQQSTAARFFRLAATEAMTISARATSPGAAMRSRKKRRSRTNGASLSRIRRSARTGVGARPSGRGAARR
jgi:hypothetical protein